MIIKKFTKELIPDVVAFEKELRLQEPNTYFWEINEDYINNLAKSFEDNSFSSTCISLLAYDKNNIVGRIDASLLFSFFDGIVHEAYLDWFCVLKKERHKGIGKLLFDTLSNELKKINIETLIILSSNNDEAIGFYSSLYNADTYKGLMIKIK